MISGIFEVAMLLCFAAAWPFNILRSWRARTALGTSIWFMLIVEMAYVFGILNKLVNDDINYVLAFYILDLLLVLTNILVFLRNRALDRSRGRCQEE